MKKKRPSPAPNHCKSGKGDRRLGWSMKKQKKWTKRRGPSGRLPLKENKKYKDQEEKKNIREESGTEKKKTLNRRRKKERGFSLQRKSVRLWTPKRGSLKTRGEGD